MPTVSFARRRAALETYFDRTAAEAWTRLTSDAPVSRIRATVRAGRGRMRALLLSWLPADMTGLRLLDAGCGVGDLARAAAERGAEVVAVDVAASLVGVARERTPTDRLGVGPGRIAFVAGDMLAPSLGRFDAAVAMDSLIHYRADDVARAVGGLAPRVTGPILITFAPRTPALSAMHLAGRLFPRADRAPAIEPVSERALRARLGAEPALADRRPGRSARIAGGFYVSQALEVAAP